MTHGIDARARISGGTVDFPSKNQDNQVPGCCDRRAPALYHIRPRCGSYTWTRPPGSLPPTEAFFPVLTLGNIIPLQYKPARIARSQKEKSRVDADVCGYNVMWPSGWCERGHVFVLAQDHCGPKCC